MRTKAALGAPPFGLRYATPGDTVEITRWWLWAKWDPSRSMKGRRHALVWVMHFGAALLAVLLLPVALCVYAAEIRWSARAAVILHGTPTSTAAITLRLRRGGRLAIVDHIVREVGRGQGAALRADLWAWLYPRLATGEFEAVNFYATRKVMGIYAEQFGDHLITVTKWWWPLLRGELRSNGEVHTSLGSP